MDTQLDLNDTQPAFGLGEVVTPGLVDGFGDPDFADDRSCLSLVAFDGKDAAAEPPWDLSPTLQSLRPVCQKCQTECDPYKAQIKSKGSQKFVCNLCNSRQVQISKMFGKFPQEEFSELSQDQMVEFWRQARDADKTPRLKMLFVDTLVKKRVDKATASVEGKYLPLSVYATQGFDTAQIEEKCTDTQQHPIFGLTYRVPIRAVERSATIAHERTALLEKLDRHKLALPSTARCDVPAVTDGPVEEKAVTEEMLSQKESEESSSSSSSSSSSDSGKKKKKKKKSKGKSSKKKNKKVNKKAKSRTSNSTAGKKQQQQVQQNQRAMQAAAKAQASIERKLLQEATRVVAKVTPVVNNCNKVLQSTFFNQIPEFAQSSIKNYHLKLVSFLQAAEEVTQLCCVRNLIIV